MAFELPEKSGFYLWGSNEWGNLGLGHSDPQPLPVRIKDSGGEECTMVGCGDHHILLATQYGDVFVSGKNDQNQLGVAEDKSFDRQTVPVLVELPKVTNSFGRIVLTKVACGFEHSLLLTENGRLVAFGINSKGECGLGSNAPVITKPTFLEPFTSPVIDFATKCHHTLVLLADGCVWGFGLNDFHQLGLDDKQQQQSIVSQPHEIRLLNQKSIDRIACGNTHSICCSSLGQTYVFGDNSHGQLGLGDVEMAPLPRPVQSLDGRRVSQLSCGFAHTVVVLADQDVVLGFGSNLHGQLGLGHTEDVKRPTRIETVCNSGGVRCVQCGYYNTFFWLDGEGLYACGANENGELGLGFEVPDQWIPVRVLGVPPCRRAPGIVASSFTVILPHGALELGEDEEFLERSSDALDSSPNRKPGMMLKNSKVLTKSSLSDDLSRLLASHVYADVNLQASSDGGLFPVHRCVTAARCVRLGKVIESKLHDIRTTDTLPVVSLPKLTSDTLRRLLLYLYSGSVVIDDASISEILLLISCATTLACERLVCICQEEIALLLDDENVILVLREACELNLLATKRTCMEYIIKRFPQCVSSRNRSMVEALGNNPELLAEVVGLSSPDYAESCISKLPSVTPCPANTLEFDMETLFESGDFADVVFFTAADESLSSSSPSPNYHHHPHHHHGNPDGAGSASTATATTSKNGGTHTPGLASPILAHRCVLQSRCPFFSSAFRALYSLKEDGDAASVTPEERKIVSLVFDSRLDADGRIIIHEVNKSSYPALRTFLLYLYTDRLDFVKPDLCCDILQMCCIYGLGSSRLAHECERLLRLHLTSDNALDTLCVATQLQRDDLQSFVMEFVIENFVECVEDKEAVTDCLFDFPQLGVELLRGVALRLRQRGGEDYLKKRAQQAKTPSPPVLQSFPSKRSFNSGR